MSQSKVLEQEANLFALLLLMPTKFIAEDLRQPIDLADDTWLKNTAKKYGVSITALTARISYYLKHQASSNSPQ
jgi:Zn-dependent peptidase ImmA (M78 family)